MGTVSAVRTQSRVFEQFSLAPDELAFADTAQLFGVSATFEVTEELVFEQFGTTTDECFQRSQENTKSVQPAVESAKMCCSKWW